MTNMTMVERVARAICDADGDEWEREGPDGLMEAYGPLARAAIEAMREPTEAMKRASRITTDIPNPCEGGRLHVWGSNVWPQMVDAALQSP